MHDFSSCRLRVLVVSSYYKPAYVYGGPVRSLSTFCEQMAKLGAEVSVATTDANGKARLRTPETVMLDGVEVHYFARKLGGLGMFYAPRLGYWLAKHIQQNDVVLVNALWGYPLFPTAQACLAQKVPYVIQLNGQLLPWALKQKHWKKRLYLEAGGRRALSNAAAFHCTDVNESKALQALGVQSPAFIVPNGVRIAVTETRPGRGVFRERLGIPPDHILLLLLGRITAIKRPDIAVSVLGAARRFRGTIHLAIAGPDGEGLTEELRAQAARLRCEEALHFTGLLTESEVQQMLSETDLLLMPSAIQENFGMSAAEALAAGVPILVSPGIPVGLLAEQAGAGRIAECTAEAFEKEALELLSDIPSLREMGQRAEQLALERFDVRGMAEELLHNLVEVAERARDGGLGTS